MTVPEEHRVARRIEAALHELRAPRRDMVGRLAAWAAVAPQVPSWPLRVDLRRRESLEVAVVELGEVWVHLDAGAESREPRRLDCTGEWT